MYWTSLFSVGKWLICQGFSSTDSLLSYMLLNLGMRTYVVKWILASFNNVTFFSFCKMFLSYLFLAAVGLCCCVWAFSSCSKQRLLSSCAAWTSCSGGFSCCRAQALESLFQQLQHAGSLVVACGLSGLAQGRSSQTRDQTSVLCIGGQICNHWTTREGHPVL